MVSEKATILAIDDTPLNLSILFGFLDHSGFKILIANDGDDGIRIAELAMPDIILLDVMMPGLDGFETCRRLKKNQTTRGIPVIFMTALSDTSDKVRGFEAGAVDYITKPFEEEEVLARITTHLTVLRQRKELEKALNEVKRLSGLLPICASCKKIRNDKGYWEEVETYIKERSEVEFSHGVCPECAQKLYPEIYQKRKSADRERAYASALQEANLPDDDPAGQTGI
jgi:CheY-like chemotaxis protein